MIEWIFIIGGAILFIVCWKMFERHIIRSSYQIFWLDLGNVAFWLIVLGFILIFC